MPGGTDPPNPGRGVALALGGRAEAAAPKCESWRLRPRGRARGREAARLAPRSYSRATGPARWQRALLLPPHPGACLLLPRPWSRRGAGLQHTCFRTSGHGLSPAALVRGRCPLRGAEEPAASCHSLPHPTREGGDPDPSWDGISRASGRGTACNQLPSLKLGAGFTPLLCILYASAPSRSILHWHQTVPGTTLPVPGGGGAWGEKVSQSGCLGQSLPCPRPGQRQALRVRTRLQPGAKATEGEAGYAGAQGPGSRRGAPWPTLRPSQGPRGHTGRSTGLARGGSGGLAVWVSFFWLKETLFLCPRIPGGVSLGVGSGREPPGQSSLDGDRNTRQRVPGLGLWTEGTLLAWRQGCLGPATIDKAASCGGARLPGLGPPGLPPPPGLSVNGAKP